MIEILNLAPTAALAESLAALPTGGIARLQPGVYRLPAPLTVDRDVVVESASGNPLDVVLYAEGRTALFVVDGAPTFRALTILSPTDESGGNLQEDDDAANPIYKAAIFVSGGSPTFVDCRVSSAARSGFGVRGSETRIRLVDCRIRRTGHGGIFLDGGAVGFLERCRISDATLACVDVEDGAFCEIRDSFLGKSDVAGLMLHNFGSAKAIGCRFVSTFADVQAIENSDATLLSSTLERRRSNPDAGELGAPTILLSSSRLRAVDCKIGAGLTGIGAGGESEIDLTRCDVEGSAHSVSYSDDATLVETDCRFAAPPEMFVPIRGSSDEDDEEEPRDDDDSGGLFDSDGEEWKGDDADDDRSEDWKGGEEEEDDDFEDWDDDEEENDFEDWVDDEDEENGEKEEEFTDEQRRNIDRIGSETARLLGEPRPNAPLFFSPFSSFPILSTRLYENERFGGVFLATHSLVDPNFDGPQNWAFDAYELALASRSPALVDSPIFDAPVPDVDSTSETEPDAEPDAALEYVELLRLLADYVSNDEVVLSPYETLEFPRDFDDKRFAGRCFVFGSIPEPDKTPGASGERVGWRELFDALAEPESNDEPQPETAAVFASQTDSAAALATEIDGKTDGESNDADASADDAPTEKTFGIMLAIEVFRDEMNWAREHGGFDLIRRLKAAGVYPFSNLNREPVVK